MFKQIVIGVDEHEGGRDAIALGRNLLAPDGQLTLAYVYAGDPHVYRNASAAYEAAERERALELLGKAREQSQLEAELRCIGSPSVGRGLHELAERQGADLLVLGSCRRSLIGRAARPRGANERTAEERRGRAAVRARGARGDGRGRGGLRRARARAADVNVRRAASGRALPG